MTVTVRPLVRDVVRELLGRKFDPTQPRDGDGKWSKDKLNLAGKMDLENGEEVAASGSFKTMGASAVMAKTSYPEYPGLESLYVGIVAPEDERKWRGHALGSTAVLDRGEVAELRKNLDGLAEKVSGEESKMIDEWDAIQEFGGHEDGADLTPEQNAQVDAFYQRYGGDRIDSGVLVEDISGSALVYNIFGAEGDDGDLQLLTAVAIRPDGEGDDWYPGRWDNAMVFEDWPEVKAFGRQLDKVDGGTDARSLSAGVVRKFDPSQPRDRRGKWKKGAAKQAAELDDMLAKFDAMAADLNDDDDDDDDISEIREKLASLRDRKKEKSERESVTLETYSSGDVEINILSDGSLSVDFDSGGYYVSPKLAKEIVEDIDAMLSMREKGELQGRLETEEGQFAVDMTDGIIEIGPMVDVDFDEDLVDEGDVTEVTLDDGSTGYIYPEKPPTLILAGSEIAEFADLLEELADRVLEGAA